MGYQALYRRYRPARFEDFVGQEAVIKTLRSQITSGRIAHAYLFCGTRGTGKTSTAKVFARAVNCEHPENGDPCGTCDTCRALAEENSLDILEIDAASNNGVDEIRDLREKVKYPPQTGRYRVYIIDEVHMLSQGAFNALLKTLEEPPAYVVFILATTEPQKLPATILSRCQRFDFGRIPAHQIIGRLRVALEEGRCGGTMARRCGRNSPAAERGGLGPRAAHSSFETSFPFGGQCRRALCPGAGPVYRGPVRHAHDPFGPRHRSLRCRCGSSPRRSGPLSPDLYHPGSSQRHRHPKPGCFRRGAVAAVPLPCRRRPFGSPRALGPSSRR